jgi:hypothetical protein
VPRPADSHILHDSLPNDITLMELADDLPMLWEKQF